MEVIIQHGGAHLDSIEPYEEICIKYIISSLNITADARIFAICVPAAQKQS